MTHAVGFQTEAFTLEWWLSRRRETASVFTGLLIAALCIDYGGGIGVKYAGILAAFAWTLTRRSSVGILRRRWRDFVVLIGIPALLASLHLYRALLFDPNLQITPFAARFYNTISSPALLLLFPLFYFAGTKVTLRQVSIGFRAVSVALMVLFLLHISGLINLADYYDVAQKYQLGMIGLDPRLQGEDVVERGQYTLRIAFSMPLIFGYELATSLAGTALLLIGFLIVGSRGLLLGAVLIMLVWFVRGAALRKVFVRLIGMGILLTPFLLLWPALRFRLTEVFFHRSAGILAGTDYTTLVRFGHLQGYYSLVSAAPWKLFLGDGPTAHLVNPVLRLTLGSGDVWTTEFSFLNIAMYYGLPYAILFVSWLLVAANRLWRLRHHQNFTPADTGLIIGALIFWITGNINPQMTAPFSMIAFMLLVVRHDEILRQDPQALSG